MYTLMIYFTVFLISKPVISSLNGDAMHRLYADRDGNLIYPGMLLATNDGDYEKVVTLANGDLGFFRSRNYAEPLSNCYIMPTPTVAILMDYRIVLQS